MRAAAEFTIDLVYPKSCAGCGRRGQWLCESCERETQPFAPPWCDSCGVPNRVGCKCHSNTENLAHIRSVGPFEGWLRGAVIQCKYHGEWARISDLATLLAEVCQTLPEFDAIVPVPLHPVRLRQRGFNQSLLLARGAARTLHAPVEEAVFRTRRTDAQARLSADERLRNVMGAMAVKPGSRIGGRSFLLIDDVITTGSTLAACAHALTQAGARSVMAGTVCREL